MMYTVRAFVEQRDPRIDEMCRTFCSMERSAYNFLREGNSRAATKVILKERYKVMNARWNQSAIIQAGGIIASQKGFITFRLAMYKKKILNMREKMNHLSDSLKIQGCEAKIKKLRSRASELERQLAEKSYPKAIFGSKKLMRSLLVASNEERRQEWKERRSNHFVSIGEANTKGNPNTRMSYYDNDFQLEIRNWAGGDFSVPLSVPEHWEDVMKDVIDTANSFSLSAHKKGFEGVPYTVRVMKSRSGYQVFVSFDLDQPKAEWTERLAGIDINPQGIACTIVSKDGNLVAARFFRDERLIIASENKRKWLLENTVNRMLRWCKDTHRCNALAVEKLSFKGAYDSGRRNNFVLSNFMTQKMLQRIKLSGLKMGMLSAEVGPVYSSVAAGAKYARRFGGFNRHQLAAFVIARRALGYGEAPALDCLPRTKKDKLMWNHCVRCYGYPPVLQTLPRHEPMERKSVGDVNGGGMITKLLRAPPATTSSQMGLSHSPSNLGVITIESVIRRAGRVHPNGHASRGDGARGHRVDPPHPVGGVSPPAGVEVTTRALHRSSLPNVSSRQGTLFPHGGPGVTWTSFE